MIRGENTNNDFVRGIGSTTNGPRSGPYDLPLTLPNVKGAGHPETCVAFGPRAGSVAPASCRCFHGSQTRVGRPRRHSAFSLIELMLGIVILGIGMTLVATIFPVAWSRARDLSDYTTQRTAIDSAHTTITAITHVASSSNRTTSFAGDLVYLTDENTIRIKSDTRVHALHMENILIGDGGGNRGFVLEDPWEIEQAEDLGTGVYAYDCDLIPLTYMEPRLKFHQRVHPPMTRARFNVLPNPTECNVDGVFNGDDDIWDDDLDTHRFVISVFHRLRSFIEPRPADLNPDIALAEAAVAADDPRPMDMYYVLLRRTQPTFRYARQNPNNVPDPADVLANNPRLVDVRAIDPDEDVMFPVAWRVQIELPYQPNDDIPCRDLSLSSLCIEALGLPTEVRVPPTGAPGNAENRMAVAQMFLRGTQFIDEESGQVYRVQTRRLVNDSEQVVLTLDREITLEDINLPSNTVCETCNDANPDPAEIIRTVWVFPPPVLERQIAAEPLTFVGAQPVVDIEVKSVRLRR